MLVADLAAVGVTSIGASATQYDGELLITGLALWTVGGPTVHVLHRQYTRAAASLGVRVGMPLVGLLVGDGIQQLMSGGDPHPWETFDGPPSPWWILGIAGGFIGASVVDARVIAGGYWPKPRTDGVTWVPTARASQRGLAFGVAGEF